jgi:two-component system OmpR family response regulator
MKILVIEDDKTTSDHLRQGLANNGHQAELAADGKTGLAMARTGNFDVLVVDRMLPQLDGLSIVKALRDAGNHTAILLLTTMSGLDDRVEGLEAGADDYLVKPFAMPELLARLNALARRPPANNVQTVLRLGGLELDLLKREVRRDSQLVDLQPQEFKLLNISCARMAASSPRPCCLNMSGASILIRRPRWSRPT